MVNQRDGVIAKLRDPPDGLLSDAELSRLFRVWTSIFKFLMKRRRKNPFLRTREIPGCSLMLLAQFLSLVKLRFLPRLALPPRLLGLRLLTRTAWRLSPLRLIIALPQTFRPLCIIFSHSG